MNNNETPYEIAARVAAAALRYDRTRNFRPQARHLAGVPTISPATYAAIAAAEAAGLEVPAEIQAEIASVREAIWAARLAAGILHHDPEGKSQKTRCV